MSTTQTTATAKTVALVLVATMVRKTAARKTLRIQSPTRAGARRSSLRLTATLATLTVMAPQTPMM